MMHWGQRQSSAESAIATLLALAILIAVGVGIAIVIGGRTPQP